MVQQVRFNGHIPVYLQGALSTEAWISGGVGNRGRSGTEHMILGTTWL